MLNKTFAEILAERPEPIEQPKIPTLYVYVGSEKNVKRNEMFDVVLKIIKKLQFSNEGVSIAVKKSKYDPYNSGYKLTFKGEDHKLDRHFSRVSFFNDGSVDTMCFRLLDSEVDLFFMDKVVKGLGFERVVNGDKVDIKVFIITEYIQQEP